MNAELEEAVEAQLASRLPEVDLRELRVMRGGSDPMLRVVIDHPEGVDHRLCADVTTALDAIGLRERYGIEVGGGLGPVAGKVWRIGCMGHTARMRNVAMLLGALEELV